MGLLVSAPVGQTNGTSLDVNRLVTYGCVVESDNLIARHHQGLALFGPFGGYGTAGRHGTAVPSDTELIAKTELTTKLVPFARHAGALSGVAQGSQSVSTGPARPVLAAFHGRRGRQGNGRSARAESIPKSQYLQIELVTKPGASSCLDASDAPWAARWGATRGEKRRDRPTFSDNKSDKRRTRFDVSPYPVSEGDGTRTRNHRIDSSGLIPVLARY